MADIGQILDGVGKYAYAGVVDLAGDLEKQVFHGVFVCGLGIAGLGSSFFMKFALRGLSVVGSRVKSEW